MRVMILIDKTHSVFSHQHDRNSLGAVSQIWTNVIPKVKQVFFFFISLVMSARFGVSRGAVFQKYFFLTVNSHLKILHIITCSKILITRPEKLPLRVTYQAEKQLFFILSG